jgi:hypothetical protein
MTLDDQSGKLGSILESLYFLAMADWILILSDINKEVFFGANQFFPAPFIGNL